MITTADSDDDARAALVEASGREPPRAGCPQPLPKGETRRLGEEIYERDIRPLIEEAHVGEYVAIDVEGGNWALADDLLAAAAKLRAASPEATNVWLIWVGYDAVGGIGARPKRRAP